MQLRFQVAILGRGSEATEAASVRRVVANGLDALNGKTGSRGRGNALGQTKIEVIYELRNKEKTTRGSLDCT